MTIAPESLSSLSEILFAGGGEMGALMRAHDWLNTPLGSIESWLPCLRTSLSTLLASRFPMCLFWGRDYIQFYNDAFTSILATKHPTALGQPAYQTWLEIWDVIKPLFDRVMDTGEAVFAEDQPFYLIRFGYREETYFTFCYSPVRDEAGTVVAVFCTATETTRRVINQRRLTMLRELATAGARAKTLQSACRAAADTLNPYDIPFALFYRLDPQSNSAELIASTGLPEESVAAPPTIALTAPSEGRGWSLTEVLQSHEAQLVTDMVDRFGVLPGGVWNESPNSAFISPILIGNKQQVDCLMIAGISPRLEFNAEYRSFLELVAQQVESSIATARSHEQERQQTEALAELDRVKTAFFNNVSHEFRTPLTLILAPAEDALADRDNALSPDQRQRVEVIQRNGVRLLKLVNTLLNFSRLESDRIQAVYEPTDLSTFTIELASVFRSAIERANLRLVVECPALPEPVYVDREMWEKIVLNLLSNACKFTFTGEITVRLHWIGDQVELAVQDTGIGIPATEIPRLFERFHQVKGAQGRTFEGSGIGLSLVQELVKLHGGTVQVSSIEGEGSSFRVTLPTGCAHLPADRLGATRPLSSTAIGAAPYVEESLQWLSQEHESIEAPQNREDEKIAFSPTDSPITDSPIPSSSDSQTKSQTKRQTKRRILLVDDNADVRNYVKRLLSERWQVETAATGAIALNMIQQQLPDLVLTDVMMPEMDGFQLLKTLRSDPITQSIPIILLSARAGEEATVEGLEAGADDYLIKPFSARELMARVETQLQMSQLRQEVSTNRFKNEFLLTVTHELQAPLTVILGWVRFLQTKSLNPDITAQALATIERHATVEANLIKDLLDVSSILAGKLRLKSQLVDLASLVQNVTMTFREVVQAKHIQLIETISDEVPSNVFADGDRLKQVISNLLENAIKFTPKGGQVNIRLERLKSGVQITVSDTGIGIRPDFLPYVFDRFTQAEVPSRHAPGGVGIGLAIARHLVELHHGTIEVASEGEGRGATFTIRLPFTNSAQRSANNPVLEQ